MVGPGSLLSAYWALVAGVLAGELVGVGRQVVLGELADQRVVAVEGLAEHEELGLAALGEPLADALGEVAPELALDVLDGVDAEAVGVGQLDPAGVRVDEGLLDVAAGGVDVLEAAGEVAGQELLRVVVIEGAALAVVDLGVLEDRRHRRDVAGLRVEREDDRRESGGA
jgi:hypothetical protein